MEATLGPMGALGVRRMPRTAPLSWRVRNALTWTSLLGLFQWHLAGLVNRVFGIAIMRSRLQLTKIYPNGRREAYGVVCRRLVTTAFCDFVVAQLQAETSIFGDFKYHDSGVGTTDPDVADTAIETTDGESRATGSQTETSALVYKSVGTIAYTTSKAITEHGLFNDPTAGTLMDRHEFAAVNVVNGDSIEFTYELTVAAGG